MSKFPGLEIGTPRDGGIFISGQPFVRRISEREFELTEPYLAKWRGGKLEVPKGFVNDLSSIPRVFWALLPKSGMHDAGSVLHDFAYHHRLNSRKWADDLFLSAMKAAGVWWLRRTLMYLAVRLFGWWAWLT